MFLLNLAYDPIEVTFSNERLEDPSRDVLNHAFTDANP